MVKEKELNFTDDVSNKSSYSSPFKKRKPEELLRRVITNLTPSASDETESEVENGHQYHSSDNLKVLAKRKKMQPITNESESDDEARDVTSVSQSSSASSSDSSSSSSSTSTSSEPIALSQQTQSIGNSYDILVSKWIHENETVETIACLPHILKAFEISEPSLDQHQLYYKKIQLSFPVVQLKLKYECLMRRSQGEKKKFYSDRINKLIKILEAIHYGYLALYSLCRYCITFSKDWNSLLNNDPNVQTRFSIHVPSVIPEDPTLSLINYCLNCFYERGYRRWNGYVYEQRISENKVPLCAWKMVGEIQKQAEEFLKYEGNYEMWATYNKKDHKKKLLENLTSHSEARFPNLKKDRHVFAFPNGVYFADQHKFHNFEMEGALSSEVVAAKYFPQEFDDSIMDLEEWDTISTPVLDSIFEFQGYVESDVKIWPYVMMGRMLYDVREKDKWEIVLYLVGQGGTGKGTVLNVMSNFYEMEDVGVLGNRTELIFSLQGIHDKFIFLCMDVKKDFNIDQATFQSMVTGEHVSVAIKHYRPKDVVWKVPGSMAANEFPKFRDAGGSVARRFFVIEFMKVVTNTDTSLGEKLKLEMPNIIKKVNMAYLLTLQRTGKRSVWGVVPKCFLDAQRSLLCGVNVLQEFLQDDTVICFNKEYYVPFKHFTGEFNKFCESKNYPKPEFSEDYWRMPFAAKELSVKESTQMWPPCRGENKRQVPGRNLTTHYIFGMDFKKNIDVSAS